ncbi:DUF3426 domain-containing protein [Thiohalorhabdus methylotrophus]|uniref:DUF3426 domain-containing protein n=1 Tax=Thiohalorhabdus methylotrophus TaxID=3242694 RepID=A0ABV4TS10_9GAMM
MEIRCPNCDTRFRVVADQLNADGTRVRCSVCSYRFLAFPDGTVRSPEPEEAGTAGEGAEPAAPPPEAPGDGEREEPAEPDPAPAPDGGADRPATGRPAASGRGSSLLLKLLVVFLMLGLVAELGYAFRSYWLAWPWARSAARSALELTGMEMELPVALRHYRAEAINARLAPLRSGRNVTLVQGVLINDASFAQRPPKLEVRALGAEGAVRYRRVKLPGKRLDLDQPLDLESLRTKWGRARAEFPEILRPGQEVPFVVVLEDVPPGIRRFRVELVP